MCRIGFVLIFLLISCTRGGDRPVQQAPNALTNQPAIGISEGEEFVIFLYHRFGDSRHLSTNIGIDDFREQMEYLKEADFEVVTLGEALENAAQSEKKRAVITVDDGYQSFLTGAMPVLNEHGYPVTLFVNTETVGAEGYLSWEQLDSLQDKGVEIGNHSHSHAYFLDFSSSEYLEIFRKDVLKAQALFEENLGMRPDLFAYPYGEYDTEMQEVVRSLGFRAAAAQNSGVVLKGQDTWALPRFPVSDAYAEIESFKDKANARAFHVRYESPRSPRLSGTEAPVWKMVTAEKLTRGRMQCFVQGGFCRLDSSGDSLIVTSEQPLDGRRTLYTITMPDRNGNWYWRSHLWINPK